MIFSSSQSCGLKIYRERKKNANLRGYKAGGYGCGCYGGCHPPPRMPPRMTSHDNHHDNHGGNGVKLYNLEQHSL